MRQIGSKIIQLITLSLFVITQAWAVNINLKGTSTKVLGTLGPKEEVQFVLTGFINMGLYSISTIPPVSIQEIAKGVSGHTAITNQGNVYYVNMNYNEATGGQFVTFKLFNNTNAPSNYELNVYLSGVFSQAVVDLRQAETTQPLPISRDDAASSTVVVPPPVPLRTDIASSSAPPPPPPPRRDASSPARTDLLSQIRGAQGKPQAKAAAAAAPAPVPVPSQANPLSIAEQAAKKKLTKKVETMVPLEDSDPEIARINSINFNDTDDDVTKIRKAMDVLGIPKNITDASPSRMVVMRAAGQLIPKLDPAKYHRSYNDHVIELRKKVEMARDILLDKAI